MAALARRWAALALAVVLVGLAATLWWSSLEGPRSTLAEPLPASAPSPVASHGLERPPAEGRTPLGDEPLVDVGAGDVDRDATAPTEERRTRLEVHVVATESGESLAGGRVRLFPERVDGWAMTPTDESQGTPEQSLKTDAQGSVLFFAEPDTDYVLMVEGSRGGDAQERVPALREGESRAITVAIRSAFDVRFRGTVVDLATGEPIAGARIEPWLISSWRGESLDHVLSASDGSFELDLPDWTMAQLSIAADSYATTLFVPRAAPGEHELEATIGLPRRASLVAEVVDRARDPSRQVSVSVTESLLERSPVPNQPTWFLESPCNVSIGPDGTCRIPLPPNVDLHVEVLRDSTVVRREPEPIHLGPGEERRVLFVLGNGCRIEGLAAEASGAPAAELELWLVPATEFDPKGASERFLSSFMDADQARRATTDGAGSFVFDAVPAGDWWLGPSPGEEDLPDVNVAPHAILVHAVEDGALEPRIVVHRDLFLRGTVVGPRGEPIGGALVACWSPGAGSAARESGPDGAFTIGPLVPGEYSLGVIHAEGFGPSEEVRAKAGEESVVLVLHPGVASLGGRVVDRMGRVVPNAHVHLTGPHGRWSGSWANAEGRFDFDGLAPGRYGVAASDGVDACGRTGWLELVSEPLSGIEVVVEKGAMVRVFLDRSQGDFRAYQEGIAVGASLFGVVVEDGGPAIDVLVPPGSVRVELYGVAEPAVRETEARLGEVSEVSFRSGG